MSSEPLIEKLRAFMEAEAHSCSMDFGCITPEYVYRMWGGTVPLEEIAEAMEQITGIPQIKVSNHN